MSKILIPTPLRKFTGNLAIFETTGRTVADSIKQLVNSFPDIRRHLLDESGNLRTFIRVYVGEEDIQSLQREQTLLQEGSIVSIIPAIAGG